MKEGDKVICLDIQGVESSLSQNKIYEIIKMSDEYSFVELVTDQQCYGTFCSHRFITIKELRKQKLCKINQCYEH